MKKETLVILTNIMTPYRKFFYDSLYKECKNQNIDFYVLLMAETEHDRHWNYDDFKSDYTILLPHKTIKIAGIEIHVNWNLKKIYKAIKPTILVCGGSYLYPSVWHSIFLRKKFGYALFEWSESHLHEARNYGKIKLKLRELIRKMVISRFDSFWYAGNFSKELLCKYAKPKSNYVFVPNLIDHHKFSGVANTSIEDKKRIKKKYNIPFDKTVFLTPARLTKVKGIEEFLELYRECNNKDAVYLIVGDGELKEDISNFIVSNKLEVRLLGYKMEKEMLEIYSITDGIILPSKSDPNPLTCIEACWCKLPLLVSNHVGNYPEIINEGKNGFVFDYNNLDVSINKIDTYLNSSHEWFKSAGEISLEVAKKIYNPEVVIPRIIKETLEIVKNGEKE